MRRYDGGPIPWGDIVKYGHHWGLDADIIDTFVVLVRAMDNAYLEWAQEQAKRAREQRSTGKK